MNLLTGVISYLLSFAFANLGTHSASEAFAWKWGFKGDISRLIEEASDKFSLLKDGTLDKTECARLLLVNVHTPLFPFFLLRYHETNR